MSLVPPNIDVWGWVKYYREPHEASLTKANSNSILKNGSKNKNNVNKEYTKKLEKEWKEQKGMFEQKHLLSNDSELAALTKKNLTLRSALGSIRGVSVALGVHVENWSAFKLGQPTIEMIRGLTMKDNDSIPAPSALKPGSQDVGIILQTKPLTGTSGVLRWTLGSADLVLSVMWSIPYNRQLWRSWLAVGLSTHTRLPSYNEMYSSEAVDPRFARREAGHRLEYSDGRFIIIAHMDGDSTYKPILRLGLVPRENALLAPVIRKQLGLKPVQVNESDLDLNSYLYQATQQQQQQRDMPSVGLVQSTAAGGASRLSLFLSSLSLPLLTALLRVN